MTEISNEQVSRYDRQIRLWGFDGQQRILNFVILKSKCIVSELKGFNPTVNIISVPQESEYTAQFFSDYDLVVASNSGMSEQVKINNVCREANIKFISANIFGLYGYIFCDLLDHDYKVEKKSADENNPDEQKITVEEHTETYVNLERSVSHDYNNLTGRKMKRSASPLLFMIQGYLKLKSDSDGSLDKNLLVEKMKDILNDLFKKSNVIENYVSEEDIKMFTESIDSGIGAGNSVLGGILAQEVIKVISRKNLPISNWLVYDVLESDAMVYRVD
ncbi:hypothetical protein BB559_006418 [Furculomyces boomerangus]|uniref:THIF-type NAD/FAD binding fold domain-containing protein n=2 Tax=Harpellales TaxID=61421 RepID=A0A2T9Y3A8_9FUNG|nr:hypothetical protein BB559_006418 [Furculomyces boomerangus]PVZ99587.1 hypothetical protein BB558_004386 [Smittium angustum]